MNKIKFMLVDDDGAEEEFSLPAVWAICSRCQGQGKHSNPSIDGNGITSEEWNGPDWSDDDRETYLTGGYDVACEAGCKDGKVLEVAPANQLTPEQRKLAARYEEHQGQIAHWDAEDRHTRRMESGGRD